MSALNKIVERMNGSFGDLRLIEEFDYERHIYIQSKDVIGANLSAGAEAGESAENRDASDGVLILKQGQKPPASTFYAARVRLAQVDPHHQNVVHHRFPVKGSGPCKLRKAPPRNPSPTDKNT